MSIAHIGASLRRFSASCNFNSSGRNPKVTAFFLPRHKPISCFADGPAGTVRLNAYE